MFLSGSFRWYPRGVRLNSTPIWTRLRETREDHSRLPPGYGIPELLSIEKPFDRSDKGQIDFAAIEQIIKAQNSSSMSEHQLLVCDIVANLLLADPGMITPDSDSFLLGGNSPLVGKLAYFIRKQVGANVAVADIFTNSTIHGIAALIDVDADSLKKPKMESNMEKFRDEDGNDSNSTLGYEYGCEDSTERGRGQTHPLSLIVQAIPLYSSTHSRQLIHVCFPLLLFLSFTDNLFSRVRFPLDSLSPRPTHQRRILGANYWLPPLRYRRGSFHIAYHQPPRRYRVQVGRHRSLQSRPISHDSQHRHRRYHPPSYQQQP